jgi:hypothetical protein
VLGDDVGKFEPATRWLHAQFAFIETLHHRPSCVTASCTSRVSGRCDLCLVSGKHIHRPLKVLIVTGRSLLETMQESRQRRSRSRATESGTFEIRLSLTRIRFQEFNKCIHIDYHSTDKTANATAYGIPSTSAIPRLSCCLAPGLTAKEQRTVLLIRRSKTSKSLYADMEKH